MNDADEFSFLLEAPEPLAPPVSVAEHFGIMEATPTTVNLSPRTAHGWQRLLSKLKVEKQDAFKEWLYQRDRIPCGVWTATAEEIELANAEVKVLKIKLKAARARLKSWLWCPWEAVPPLNCHVVNLPPIKTPPRRLWTFKKKREYRAAEIRELTEKLAHALMISKRPDRATVKPPAPDQNVFDAEAKYESLSLKFAAAEKGFLEFKLKGPPPETEAEEIARRMALVQAQADCAVGTGAVSAGGAAAVGGAGMGGQGHRPELVPIEELPRQS